MGEQICYIALGSNLSNPSLQLNNAITAITALPCTQLLKQSSRYQTAPHGPIEQPDYINAVIAISTQSPPEQLLKQLQTIEQAQGRTREIRWGPRTLDLDILLYGNLEISTQDLTIPHVELKKRNFVLYPLAEIAPSLILPDGTAVADLLETVDKQGISIIQPETVNFEEE